LQALIIGQRVGHHTHVMTIKFCLLVDLENRFEHANVGMCRKEKEKEKIPTFRKFLSWKQTDQFSFSVVSSVYLFCQFQGRY